MPSLAGLTTTRARWLLAALVIAQFVVLYDPSPGVGSPVPGGDKLVHGAIFAAPVIAAGFALQRWWWFVALQAVHAPVSEAIQGGLLPGRSADPWDVVADLVGVALGVGASMLLGRAPGRRW